VEVRSSKATNESETTRGFGVSENLHIVKEVRCIFIINISKIKKF